MKILLLVMIASLASGFLLGMYFGTSTLDIRIQRTIALAWGFTSFYWTTHFFGEYMIDKISKGTSTAGIGKFSGGRIVMTPGVSCMLDDGLDIGLYLTRHFSADWGDLSAGDKRLNDAALKSGQDRIFSAYETEQGKIWIITEWDRSITTVLRPSEY